MAFATLTHWCTNTAGVDGTTGNGGGFDPGNSNMAADLASADGNSSTPTVTSASYTFQARDVGHWLFIKSGTNWLPGWYQIAGVAAGAATIEAIALNAVSYTTLAPTLVNGCATIASPSAGVWSIDYSQSTGAGIAYTDAVVGGTTTQFTSVLKPVGPNIVGNVFAVASGGTVQRAQVSSVSGTTATCDKSLGTAAQVCVGNLGGALASLGQALALHIASNVIWGKSGTYAVTSATPNIASGCLSLTAGSAAAQTRLIGFGSVRGDGGTKPLLQASGISTFTLITVGSNTHLENVSVDGALLTASKGISAVSGRVYRCKAANCTNSGLVGTSSVAMFIMCEATGCSTQPAVLNGNHYSTLSHDNTHHGFGFTTNGLATIKCRSRTNIGSGIVGFHYNAVAGLTADCISYGNTSDGFYGTSTSAVLRHDYINCLAVGNGGWGYNFNGAVDYFRLITCAAQGNSGGTWNPAAFSASHVIGFVTLATDPFANAAGDDFSLNSHPTGGALLKAAGIPGYTDPYKMPGSTLNYQNISGLDNALQFTRGIMTGGRI